MMCVLFPAFVSVYELLGRLCFERLHHSCRYRLLFSLVVMLFYFPATDIHLAMVTARHSMVVLPFRSLPPDQMFIPISIVTI